jgi:hypothetical protein
MAATRSESLKHLMTVVLDLTEHDKPWRLVHHHHKCNTLLAFDRLTEAQLCETFQWDPLKGKQMEDTVLDGPEVDELQDIQEWIRHNKMSLTADWVAKKPIHFAEFTQGLIQGPTGIILPTVQSAAASTTANPAPPVAITSLTAYGLKRDLKDYAEITQRHFFLPWADNIMTTAIMHNSCNPLDPAYVPGTDLEKAIFRLDNTFMYAVFLKTVKYSSGKTILARFKKAMDGQAVYQALTEEATGTAVRQINETKCQKTLKEMDCDPNKWSQSLESFLDLWLIRKGVLDDVRVNQLPEDEAITWFTESVKAHPILLAAIQQQEGVKKIFLRSFPGKDFVQSLNHFMDDIRLTCVQYDSLQTKKPAKWTGPKDNANRRANAANAVRVGQETDQSKKEAYEKYKEQLKAAGLWIEPDTYNSWTPAQKKAHTEKVKVKRVGKKSRATPAASLAPVPELPPTPPTPPSPPPPYATMAAGHSAANPPQVITMFGRTYRAAACIYKATGSSEFEGSLIDGGCNGGLAGSDVLILETHPFGKVNIIGVGDNVIENVPLCTAAGLIQTSEGPVIAIMHNYAALGKGGSIHSPLQLKDHGVYIDDTPKSQKRFDGEFGTQMVRIATGSASYDIPLVLNGGLPYLKMCPPTQEQLNNESIPHVLLTSDMPWEPSKYDENYDEQVSLHPSVSLLQPENEGSRAEPLAVLFSEMERVRDFEATPDDADNYNDEFSELHDSDISESNEAERNSHFSLYTTIPNVVASFASLCGVGYEANKTYLEHKYGKTLEEFRPNFGFIAPDRVKATIEASTQFFRAHQWSKKIKRHFKSRFPGANVERVNETVSTDTAYMEVKGAADGITGHGGAMGFQLFVGNESKHLAVYTLKTDGE